MYILHTIVACMQLSVYWIVQHTTERWLENYKNEAIMIHTLVIYFESKRQNIVTETLVSMYSGNKEVLRTKSLANCHKYTLNVTETMWQAM